MMRILFASALAILLAASTSVHAQTIEKSYAEQCSSGQQSETCDLLRKALLEKLQLTQAASIATDGRATSRSSDLSPAPPVLTEAEKSQWGVIGEMAGALWADNEGSLMSFEWVEPGRRLKLESERAVGGRSIAYMTPDPAQPGTLEWKIQLANGIARLGRLTIFPDGTAHWQPGKVVWQMTAPGRVDSTKGKVRKDGTYSKRGEPIGRIRRVSSDEYRELLARRDARLRQQAARDTNDDRGGMVGALIGAAVGAYAGSAAGMDAADTAALMAQGAAAASPNSAIGQGLAKGWSEETSKNAAMQRSMDEAISRGLAAGAAGDAGREAQPYRSEAGGAADVSQESAPAGTGQAGQAVPQVEAKPLRFVLMIGMRNLPGDRNNSVCYSNVITRPGPPGWGERGFLPSGSGEQALQQINSMKDEFIAACERKGRVITNQGNFTYRWNQSDRDEQDVQATKPRVPEDLSVVLD